MYSVKRASVQVAHKHHPGFPLQHHARPASHALPHLITLHSFLLEKLLSLLIRYLLIAKGASRTPITPHTTSSIINMSYAAVAASGPKQTPEEAAAPPQPEIEHTDSASTASLIDVDTPSVHTVSSDFREQEIQTETQQTRIEHEHEHEKEAARAEADLAKKKVAHKAKKADNILTKWFGNLSDGQSSALVLSNLVGVIGLSGFLGYKAWDLHERGRLGWKNVGLGFGILAAVGAVEGLFGGYLYKGKKKQQ